MIKSNPTIFIFFFLSSVSICMHKIMIQFFVSGDITIKRIFEFDWSREKVFQTILNSFRSLILDILNITKQTITALGGSFGDFTKI